MCQKVYKNFIVSLIIVENVVTSCWRLSLKQTVIIFLYVLSCREKEKSFFFPTILFIYINLRESLPEKALFELRQQKINLPTAA